MAINVARAVETVIPAILIDENKKLTGRSSSGK